MDADGIPFEKEVDLDINKSRFINRFTGMLLIILMSIVNVGCKTAEQRQIEKYQNLKPNELEV